MSQSTHGVYRCPSCDELAEADIGDDGAMTCSKCGHVSKRKVPQTRKRVSMGLDIGGGGLVQRNVVSRRQLAGTELPPPIQLPEGKEPLPGSGEQVSATGHRQEVVADDGDRKIVRRHKKRRKGSPLRLLFVALWALAICLIVLTVRKQMKQLRKEASLTAAADRAKREERKAAEARAFVRSEFPACSEVLGDFIKAADPAARAQFVLGGSELAPKMANHYRQNTVYRPSEILTPGASNLVLWDGNKPVIETAWTSADGERVEAVFAREAGGWKIDWEAFVRYSSQPWHLFVSGVGGGEGEFRVWAKVQRGTSISRGEKVLTIRFYPPVVDALQRNRAKSPAVLVPLGSESGMRVLEIMEEHERQRKVGDRRLFLEDPMNLYRMRVDLEWREGANGRNYLHLAKVHAGHWLGNRFEQEFEDEAPPEETIIPEIVVPKPDPAS